MWRREPRLRHPRDAHRHGFGGRFREVVEHDDRQIEVGIALNRGLEALPRATVPDAPQPALLRDAPPKAVGVSAAVVETDGRPARFEPGPTRDAPMVQGDGPLREV